MALNVPNLDKLIAHLEAQPPERINMGTITVRHHEKCGAAGCILGHAKLIWPHGFYAITEISLDQLFEPDGWLDEDTKAGGIRYPAHRVIATLKRLRDRFLATGEIVVDWGPEPGDEPAQPWAAPQAIELTAPALPEAITRLLSAEPVTTATEA